MKYARNALIASLTMFFASMAHAQVSTQIGTLACDVSRGIGMIVMQKQTLTCTFQRDAGGPAEIYIGSLDEYGVAIGDVASGHLVWGVIAAGKGVPAGALAGTYRGVGTNASFIVGAGANVLVGGTERAFSLQPISVQGQMGVNIAGGLTVVTLKPST